MKLSDKPTREEAVEYAAHLETQAKAEARKKLLGLAGVEEGDDADDTLKKVSAEAKDGRAYRDDLLEQLGSLTVKAEGNGEAGQAAAKRVKKVFAGAELEDIKDEVERLKGKVNKTFPNTQQSDTDSDPPANQTTLSSSAYG